LLSACFAEEALGLGPDLPLGFLFDLSFIFRR
jgi:hypothetical protein